MSPIDDEMLLAYVDGELDAGQRAEVEAATDRDPALARRLQAHARLREAAGGAFGAALIEPVPARLRAAVETEAVVRPDFRARRLGGLPQWAALAACLAVGVFAGQALDFRRQPLRSAEGGLVAQGELARALDRDLSAGQGPIRIGLSFRSARGYCRTFELQERAIAGLACRGDGAWRVPVTASAAAHTGAYRQAVSATPAAVLAAVDELIVGEPLDRAQEEVARKSNWR